MVSTHQVAGSTPAGGARTSTPTARWNTHFVRRAIPHILLATLTLLAGLAALSSTRAASPDAYGMLPSTSVPWGRISLGWQLGRFTPRDRHHAVNIAPPSRLFIMSPEGVRYRLAPTGVRTVDIADWSQDGRYVVTVEPTGRHNGSTRDVVTVRDLTTWAILSRFDIAQAHLPDPRQTDVTTAGFFGPGHRRLLIGTSSSAPRAWWPTTDYVVLATATKGHVEFGSPLRARDKFEFGTLWLQAHGNAVLTEGSTVLALDRNGWQRRDVGTTSCFASGGWWTSTQVLEQCELTKEGNTQLFRFDLNSGTRTAVSPRPGFMLPDATRGTRTWAYGYSDAWRVSGRTFLSANATCGPGWVEVATGSSTRVVPESGGGVVGVAPDALVLSVVRGECFGGWAITRLDPATLRQRDLLTGRTLPGKVDMLGTIVRYHVLGD